MTNKEKVKGFFAGVEGDQTLPQQELLPTKKKDGAPDGNLWLTHFVEGDLEIRYTNADAHPYISYRAEVDEPVEYEGRNVFGMFFPPRPIEDPDDEEEQEKYDGQMKRFVGQIDAVLGEGTCGSLDTDDLESSLMELIPMLENSGFVAKIGFERGKKKDPEDTDKDAERHPNRNRISHFYHADTWQRGG